MEREHLPQIPKDQLIAFVKFLHGHDVAFQLHEIPVAQLKPIQSQVKNEKVEALMQTPDALKVPLVVSSDYYILDGHHRWLAKAALGVAHDDLATATMKCVVCDCDITDLIELGHEFEGSFTASVHETTTETQLASCVPSVALPIVRKPLR